MKKLTYALLPVFLIVLLFTSCNEKVDSAFYRKVARETLDNGWTYVFVHEGLKDPNADESGVIRYNFFGMNIRYKYDDAYIQKIVHKPGPTDKWKTFTEIYTPPFLTFGEGPEAEKRDREKIDAILNDNKNPEDLLALNPDDYTFEVLDKDMFFRLMKTALTSEPQKEGQDITYWEKPSYAFLTEPTYIDGYKFQVVFLQETGCVDELYIDVLYKTGKGLKDYTQLSDLVDAQTATPEQQRAFDEIKEIVKTAKQSESFLPDSAIKKLKIGELDFSRLYNFLKNIHENKFELYIEDARVDKVEGIVE